MLGVATRSSIIRDIHFPQFIWDYIATGNLKLEDIFSIDTQYRDHILSLENAITTNSLSKEIFKERFHLNFVVRNSLGDEIVLTEQGRTKSVTLTNCREYISLSNDFRLAELREYLMALREGVWENLDFKPPIFVDGQLIKYCCCGDTQLTVDALMSHVTFGKSVPPKSQALFKKIVAGFSAEQLTMLLRFTTAREKLPTQPTKKPLFTVHFDADKIDRCPYAKTCFQSIYIPRYSSLEIAKNLILAAITSSRTFDIS